MANSGMGSVSKQFGERVTLEYERRAILEGMGEGTLKDWIIELLAANKGLGKQHSKAMKALGNSAFSPVKL